MKNGLDYFPIDIDFFDDDKIQFVSARFGIKGEIIIIRLLSRIYRNGYYLKLDEDTCLLIAKKCGDGVNGALVDDVVTELVRRGFFDIDIFNSFGVITSNGIQKRFFEAVKRRKIVSVIGEYLVPKFKCIHNANILRENVNISKGNVNISEHSKVEESKVKESKVEESGAFAPPRARVKDKKNPILFRESEFFEKKTFAAALENTQYEPANADYYHEVVLNWSDSKNAKKVNWLATVKNWMARDMTEGKFITKDFKPPQNGKLTTTEKRQQERSRWHNQ